MRLRAWTIAVALIVLACVLGPAIAGALGVDGTTIDARLGATPPSAAHRFGTDVLGRDLLVRVLVGGRIALGVGLAATAIAIALGTSYGAIAAYAGGVVDEVMMRAVDALYALPTAVLVVVVMAVLDTRSLAALFAVIAGVSWLTTARIARGEVLAIRRRGYVEAAANLGASPVRVLARHVLPNARGPILAYATAALPQVMLLEAFLSFLGLGVQAPLASWGTLVIETSQIVVYPWLIAVPGIAMGVTIATLHFLADALRDKIEPR